MDEKTAWDMYFASICAIRFHPKNVPPGETLDEDELHEIDFAAHVADEMLRIRRTKQWPPQPDPQSYQQ